MAGTPSPAMPRLRRDAYLIPTDNGARILTNAGAESLTGATIHQWINALAPHLDGTRSLDALIAPLSEDKREQVRRIVAALTERALIRDGGDLDRPPGELGYLDSFVPLAHRAYQDYRTARLVVTGSGEIFTELVRTLAESGADGLTTEWPVALDGADLVVYVSDHSVPDRAQAVAETCRANGIALVAGVRRAGELWIGADSESGWHRLRQWGEPVAVEEPPDQAAVSVAAGMIGMAVFRRLTGAAGPADEHSLLCLDLKSLRGTVHRYLAYRNPPAERSIVDTVAALRARAALDPDELDAAGSRLLDPRLGVIGEVSERDFAQLPLNVAGATVPGWSRPLIGAGLTVKEARWRAVLAGVAAYASAEVTGEVSGVRLAGGGARLINVAQVSAGSGVAAGYSWAQAVSTGLLTACAELAALHARARLEPQALDEESQAYLRMLRILNVPLTVHDATGPVPMPTLAFGVAGRTVAYVCAYQPSDAMAAGLRAVLLDEQSRRNGQPDYAPPPVRQLDTDNAPLGQPPEPCTETDLIAALAAMSLDPVAVPLDRDLEVHRILPYLVRVVLADA